MLWFEHLSRRIELALEAERFRFCRRLQQAERAHAAGRLDQAALDRLSADVERSVAHRAERQLHFPRVAFDNDLPVTARREEIAAAIREHAVTIVCGETGSGKSTQLPKICLDLGRGRERMIGHTQPRRLAARSIAARLAQELGLPLGQEVGYKIRFTDATHPRTYVKLMTDGVLLAESRRDRYFDAYDTLLVDEAHERSLNIDFLLGLLRQRLPRRPDLRVIVTSATIDAERFAAHFRPVVGEVPIVRVAGQTWPVEVRYRPPPAGADALDGDWLPTLVDAVEELARLDRGHILAFLPTEQDIHAAAKALRGRTLPGDTAELPTQIVPLYARLPHGEQRRVFEPYAGRRVVLATNVAESSLTVPGMKYVVDTGTARIRRYSARSKVARLPIEPISRASAEQRKGRCGREQPGICIRLYSEADYRARDADTPPEMLRAGLAGVLLQAQALGLGNLSEFPLLDRPRPESIAEGLATLHELGALNRRGELTSLGTALAELPVDPRIGRIVIAGAAEGCLDDILVIAAALEVQDPRDRPHDRRQSADEHHAQFLDPASDFLAYLRLWDFVHDLKAQASRNQFPRACREHFLSPGRVREWLEVHRQLQRITAQAGYAAEPSRRDLRALHRALLAGYLAHVAVRTGENEYTVAGGQKARLWPGSGLFAARPKWVVAGELVETTQRYLRCVGAIEKSWIEPLARHLVERELHDPYWDPEARAALGLERVALGGLTLVRGRRTRLAPHDPGLARELFLRDGLVRGGDPSRAPFLAHNRELVARFERLQRKCRRGDLVRGEWARLRFYEARLPDEVVDGPTCDAWRRTAERAEPRRLFMTPADVVADLARVPDEALFPDQLTMRGVQFELEYVHDPADAADGVTVVVPRAALGHVDPARLDWHVPGWLEHKVVALVRTLPKGLRRNLGPVPDAARRIVAELRFGHGSLLSGVARAASTLAGELVRPEDFRVERLSEWLRLRLRVVDVRGPTLAAGRDLRDVRRQLGLEPAAASGRVADPRWTRRDVRTWDFGELPEAVEVEREGLVVAAYPALVERDAQVDLELCATAEDAARRGRAGLRRLVYRAVADEVRPHVAWWPPLGKLRRLADGLADAPRLDEQLTWYVVDRAFLPPGTVIRTAEAFRAALEAGRERLPAEVQDALPAAARILEAHHAARGALGTLARPAWQYAAADVARQLEQLCPEGFLVDTPAEWLAFYPRYLRAIRVRAERLAAGGAAHDRAAYERLRTYWDNYLDAARASAAAGGADPALVRFRWLIEEFRVALFAEQLGTAVPVSAARLDEQWARVRVA